MLAPTNDVRRLIPSVLWACGVVELGLLQKKVLHRRRHPPKSLSRREYSQPVQLRRYVDKRVEAKLVCKRLRIVNWSRLHQRRDPDRSDV
jgi:hypothetical protein